MIAIILKQSRARLTAMGIAGLLFFTAKGILWLLLPALIARSFG